MSDSRSTARLEAFCDGVFAIALTLLIIDIKLPAAENLDNSREVWRALQQLTPSVFAFLLSFVIIFITWVNHHAALRLVSKAPASLIYANGLLLLTVVFVPFPTALLGDLIFTDHAAPAVVLYDSVLVLQSLAWILMGRATLRHGLTRDEKSVAIVREHTRNGYFAFVFYGLLSIMALWFPLTVAIITTLSWILWLILGVRTTRA